MLINLSNHPFSTWSNKQLKQAELQFGEVVDYPFPYVNPESSIEKIQILAHQTFDEIILKYGKDNIQIHLMGELSLVYQLTRLFKANNIRCYVSTTDRIVEELGNGQKNIQFQFVKFRPYY